MKEKGFTLVELLAVIIILALLALITSTSVTKLVKDSKDELSATQIKLIESAAKTLAADNLNVIPKSGKCAYITLGDLKEYGLIDSKVIDASNNQEISDDLKIKLSTTTNSHGNPITNYEINPSNVSGCLPAPISFKGDSWETIAANVKAGNLSAYKVGDTKEVTLTGDVAGTYTVRIANTSTPSECSTEGFSQSACGFVIEFVDIITTHKMNPSTEENEYGTNEGGWPASEMYKFLNDTTDETITSIYESLPEDLRKVIVDTQVISSHGASDTFNFTSTDKLYLLSTKEVWGKEGTTGVINHDTAEVETRQLDYYKEKGVTTSNLSEAIKKYEETATIWWLRSAYSYSTYTFYYVVTSGDWHSTNALNTGGVAPAFRIG